MHEGTESATEDVKSKFPAALLRQTDRAAANLNMTRSAFIRMCVDIYINGHRIASPLFIPSEAPQDSDG